MEVENNELVDGWPGAWKQPGGWKRLEGCPPSPGGMGTTSAKATPWL